MAEAGRSAAQGRQLFFFSFSAWKPLRPKFLHVKQTKSFFAFSDFPGARILLPPCKQPLSSAVHRAFFFFFFINFARALRSLAACSAQCTPRAHLLFENSILKYIIKRRLFCGYFLQKKKKNSAQSIFVSW